MKRRTWQEIKKQEMEHGKDEESREVKKKQ